MQAEGVEPGAPYRLRIGVTGHRRLPDIDELAARVDEVLDVHIPGLVDSATSDPVRDSARRPLVFTVITPLAEGADRRVAETILKRPDAEMEVILPLAVADYMGDFQTAASRSEFKRLLELARRPVSLRETPLAAEFALSDMVEARRRAYEHLGHCLVDCCDVLIAVWDGEQARGKGGTAEVVGYARGIGRPVVIIRADKSGGTEVHAGKGIRSEPFLEMDGFAVFEVSASDI